jgi:1-phosphatidylinositol-3-phosphate 5-kinase
MRFDSLCLAVQLCQSCVKNLVVDVWAGDSMDVRNYVHIKRIQGSAPTASQDFSGVVMSKNVVHKLMRSTISKAR